MARALVRLLASLVAVSLFAAIAHCDPGHFYPISAAMARADITASLHDYAASAPPESFGGGAANERTIRALSDEEEAPLARRFIGTEWNGGQPQGDARDYVASLQMAAAFGSILLWLASLWDPRLTSVLLWLFLLGLLLRPPRVRPDVSKMTPED